MRTMRIALSQVLSFSALALVITFTGVLPAIAQEKPQLAQDAAKEVVPATAVEKSPVIDYKSLIGEYAGEWRSNYGSDKFYFELKKVEGNVGSGTVFIDSRWGGPHVNRDVPFTGTISGEKGKENIVYTLATGNASGEFTREGNKLTGTFRATVPANVEVTKIK